MSTHAAGPVIRAQPAFALGILALTFALAPLPAAAGQPPPPAPADGLLSYSGTARDQGSSEFVYGEQHYVRFVAGVAVERVVLYTCAGRSAFARKVVSYLPARAAPDFAMEDAASGYSEGLRTSGTQRTVYFRAGDDGPEERALPAVVSGLVADAGFDEYVRERWDDLMHGERVRLDFLVPSRLEAVSFKLRRLRSERIAGKPVEVLRLGLSGVWAFIAPHIDVYYGRDDRVLLRYEGVSNLRDAAGDNYEVRIEFPPEQRRALQGLEAMDDARRAPLESACR